MLFGEDDQSCEVCRRLINVVPSGDLAAHWGGPGRVVIEAWTYSPVCTDRYHENVHTTDCCLVKLPAS